jgi:hypothetical protein
MGNGSYQWNVTDSTTGKGISQAFVNIAVGTNPCKKDVWGNTNGCNSGPGYNIQTYTNSSGVATAQAKYNCPSDLSGTISAAGYASQDFTDSTGVQSGTTYYTVALAPSTLGSSVGNVPGQGLQTSTTTPSYMLGIQAGGVAGNIWGNLVDSAENLGWIAAVIVIGIAIALVAVAVLVRG